MASESAIRRYRGWYARLLRLYPRSHRERFGEPMEQTFGDLLRERANAGRGLFGFTLWTFFETSGGIMREHVNTMLTQTHAIRIAIGVAAILSIPLVAMQYSDQVKWTPFDFVVMGSLLFGIGMAFDLISRRGGSLAYKVAVGLTCAATLFLIWVNGAVGIIGDGPVNLLYVAVVGVLLLGAAHSRLEPRGLAWTLFAAAATQMLVPTFALLVFNPPFSPGVVPVFLLNGVFAAVFATAGLLFLKAAGKSA